MKTTSASLELDTTAQVQNSRSASTRTPQLCGPSTSAAVGTRARLAHLCLSASAAVGTRLQLAHLCPSASAAVGTRAQLAHLFVHTL